MQRAYRRHHLAEAIHEVRAAAMSVKRDRADDAAAEHPDLFAKRDGRFVSAELKDGDHVGALTLARRLTEKPLREGGHRWLCRCDCGRSERVIRAHYLAYATRVGREPCCALCMRERKVVRFEANREVVNEGFRRQFVDYGTLWLPGQTRRLQERIRGDLEEAFGPPREELPAMRFGFLELEACWNDVAPARQDWRRAFHPGYQPKKLKVVPEAPKAPAAVVVRPGDVKPWKKPRPLFGPRGPSDADLEQLRTGRANQRAGRAAAESEAVVIDAALERAKEQKPPAKPRRRARARMADDVLCPCKSGLPQIVCHGATAVSNAPAAVTSKAAWRATVPPWVTEDTSFPLPPGGHMLVYSTVNGFAYVSRAAYEALPALHVVGHLRVRITGRGPVDAPAVDVAIAMGGAT